MRLDFDGDDEIGIEEIRKYLKKLMIFLRELDSINKTNQITNLFYQTASEMFRDQNVYEEV